MFPELHEFFTNKLTIYSCFFLTASMRSTYKVLRYLYRNNYVNAFGKNNKFLFQFYLNNASGFTYKWQLTVSQIHLTY